MFFAGSRYERLGTYAVRRTDGRTILVTRLPVPAPVALAGYHRRLVGQRLDHLATHYLADATGFWRLCDANNTLVPDALAVAELVGIPRPGAR